MQEQRGYDRIVFFSDAVVAIAITLLVLPLVESASDVTAGGVSDLIAEDRNKLIAFAVSFVVISRYWIAHHRIFRPVIRYDDHLVRANFLWLASIVFLPFPTELIGAKGDVESLATGLYIGTLAVTTGSLVLLQWMLRRKPELLLPEARGQVRLTGLVASFAAMVLALVLALAVPGIHLWALLLLIPAGWIHSGKPRGPAPS